MTYCLGILLQDGLVMASDSRSNAGVDDITSVCKMEVIDVPGERVIVILSAGNLATTQSVITELREALGKAGADDLHAAATLYDAARAVGGMLRVVVARDGAHVSPYGDATGSFIVGGQIGGEAPRLFRVYPAGNFVEASARASFLQIGEAKYGKPILDRALSYGSPLDEAAKLALLSFDATMRSDLSVDMPIDILRYETGSLSAANRTVLEKSDPYWRALSNAYGEGLATLVERLPRPPDWRS
ncbi:peptidase [Emcibacter sp. SYSU 3D8]|uniref:peptidase n=1 Tax=Emcibacter sp. SYSU 3D8 TaxID=3133969 RepID=UPI0031FE680F